MKITISAIIPIYNVSNYIEKCTRSLMEQTFKDVEFIFVDDCSPDNSIEILQTTIEDYPDRIPYIKIIHNTRNLGLAATRFIGFKESRGSYIWHCDSDDWVEKEMLQKMYDKAIAEDADIVCCEAMKEYQGYSTLCEYNYDKETLENGLLNLSLSEVHIAIWNKLIRKELYTKYDISFYEGINMGEDSALTIRLRYYSKKTVIIHEPLYHYNRTNSNSMVRHLNEGHYKQRIELAKHIESFFTSQNEFPRFRQLVNFYKFDSKQFYLREHRDIIKWKKIFPECHRDIIKFKHLSFVGKAKWLFCAYMPFAHIFIRKNKQANT